MNEKTSLIIILAGLFLCSLLSCITLAAMLFISTRDPNDIRACTLEAKLCPDGSAVGRTGPNCEFAKCPGER